MRSRRSEIELDGGLHERQTPCTRQETMVFIEEW